MSDLLRALDDARDDRVTALRGEARPHDTLHRIDVCVTCGRVSRRVAVLADGPGGDTAAEVARWTVAQVDTLPLADTGCTCASSAAGRLAALAYARALAGRGVECVREGWLVEGWTWRWRLRALDGVAVTVDVDDLPAWSGRAAWRAVLDRGAAGEAVLLDVEPGLAVFAGPREATLEARVKARAVAFGRGLLLPLKLLALRPVVSEAEAWTRWAAPHAEAIQRGDLRAGAVIDLDALRQLVRLAAARAGASATGDDPRAVSITRGELTRAVDLERLALSLTLRGDGLADGASRAVAGALDLLTDAASVVSEVRAMRPAFRFTLDAWNLLPERPDGTPGPPIALPHTPGEYTRDRAALERAVRFACDVLPPWSDPSRVCPCGAPACFVARLLPAAGPLGLEGSEAAPVILARWPERSPTTVLVAGVGCELHTWFPPAAALAALGLGAAEVAQRVAHDAPLAAFAFEASVQEEDGARALVVRGHHAASLMADDHLVAALHRASDAPLRGANAGALALSTSTLVVYEPALSPASLDRLCVRIAASAASDDALLASRDVRLDALPRGRMIRRVPGAVA